MLTDTKDDALKRLKYIEGHLAGVRKMIEEDRYCVDVIHQTFAIRRALQKLESELIDGHLRSCVPDAFRDGRDEQMLTELKGLFEISER
jgi:DNA-binding FrmR family transcriptional regulator